jgi:RNA repair, ligase-Pnkp-associating, region of Hen1
MLLTLTTTHTPATDLGYLLHKNPGVLRSVDLWFGQAHVFYPEATVERCTAALLIDVDPIGLVRRKGRGPEPASLEPYVNDRPYAASSFMSVALAKLFGTAMTGRSAERQELADTSLPL